MSDLSAHPHHLTDFVRILHWRAERQPNRLAFSFLDDRQLNGRDLTYAELDHHARVIAAALLERGLSGERAVLLFQPGADYIIAILGCWYAGVTAVTVYAPRLNASYDRVRLIVANAQAAAMLSTANVLAALDNEEWQELRREGLQELAIDVLPKEMARDWRMPAIDADTLAVLQYTSGSTGQPKGVRLQQRHLVTNSRMISRAMRSDAESVGVVWLPPYHDMGLIGGVLQPLYGGFPVYMMVPAVFLQRPLRWLEAMTRYGGTISAAPNFAYDLCVKRAKPEQIESLDLSCWRVAVNGAEPIRAETMHRFSETFGPAGFDRRAFSPSYGMAETTLMVASAPHFSGARTVKVARNALAAGTLATAKESGVTLVSSGRADPEVCIAIADPNTGRRSEPGRIGEIWVTGATVADGYWARPDATEDTFRARLPGDDAFWLRTGDLGTLLDGELFVTGRIKDLIVIRGRNHYPHDIEATALAAHPAIRPGGAAAFAVDSDGVEELGLVLELDRGWLPSDLADAAVAVREAISREHELHPAELVFVRANTIPKTSSGKVQRLLTRERLLAGELDALIAGAIA